MEYVATRRPRLDASRQFCYMTEDGHFTNGHYSVIPDAKDSFTRDFLAKEKADAIGKIIGDLPYIEIEFSYILQISAKNKYKDVLVYKGMIHDHMEKIIVNREYVDIVLSRYPHATIKAFDDHLALAFYYEDVLVGVVMPIIV